MPRKFDFISPGIELTEIDRSVRAPAADEHGPIIIGRTRKGPAQRPVKIRSLDDYLSVFGRPNAGGSSPSGDLWRDGAGSAAPTYASYAAQAWLAGGTAPVTMVRMLGSQNASATTAGKAGWQLTNATLNAAAGSNSTAYGLFIVASSSANNDQTGSLAAILYADSGFLKLKGNEAGTSVAASGSCLLVESAGADKEFQLIVGSSAGAETETINFNFNRNSGKYIRKVLNTNPTITNTTISSTSKSYWLGETFERHLTSKVSSNVAADQYGVLLPLQTATDDTNWSAHREGYQAAGSGWVISNNDGAASGYTPAGQPKMFRTVCLQEGESIQAEILISIENMNLPTNPEVYAYSSFDLVVRSAADGTAIERYSNLSMDENSTNFIARRIGDMYQEWDSVKRRWRMYGDYPNQSDYVRIVMADTLPVNKAALPFGFLGPGRPKSFAIASGSAVAKASGGAAAFANAFVKKGDAGNPSITGTNLVEHNITGLTASFDFPSISIRKSGSDGFANNPYQAMWGIRPKISDSSNLYDNDYIDYLRRLPASYASHMVTPTGDFEHSFTFSLDNLIVNTGSNVIYHEDDSHAGGTSFTSQDNSGGTDTAGDASKLLQLGVSNWAMPLFGGFDGFNIKEIEPFRNLLMSNTDTDTGNYLANTFNQAVAAVDDSEVVPANLILAPGLRNAHLTNKLIAVADSRQDILAIVDLENDYTPSAEAITTDTKASRRGSVVDAVSSLKTRNIDSSFGCAFYPWVQITDRLGGSELVWVPPSIAALGAMAKSDSLTDVWFAPAGFNRGGLGSLGGPSGPTVVQARQRLDAKDRDDLYAVGINPIASFPNEGLVVFGQKTLQQRPSALDRINVRRLMLYLKSKIGDVAKNTLFQNNVPATWSDFKGKAEPILSDVKNRFGLTDYKLILDETTTTPDLIDRNILYAKVFLKPARAIEYIAIDFVITKTGADFV